MRPDDSVGPQHNSLSLAARLGGTERLPLELALSVATEVVEAVATVHQRKLAFGHLTAIDLMVSSEGAIAITAAPAPDAEAAADTFEVGSVLFQIFTGITPSQARERLRVDLPAVPEATSINPAVDDELSAMLSQMLSQEPTLRPHSLRVVEGVLSAVCERLEVEPSRAAILRWAESAPPAEVHTLATWAEKIQPLPLELSLSLATGVVEALATAHQRKLTFGRLTAKDFVISTGGAIEIAAMPTADAETTEDTFALGMVLFQLFTGLTPSQAREQLKMDANTTPDAASINPSIDAWLSLTLSKMLHRDPTQRPHSLRVVECVLSEVCEKHGVEPSRAAVLGFCQGSSS